MEFHGAWSVCTQSSPWSTARTDYSPPSTRRSRRRARHLLDPGSSDLDLCSSPTTTDPPAVAHAFSPATVRSPSARTEPKAHSPATPLLSPVRTEHPPPPVRLHFSSSPLPHTRLSNPSLTSSHPSKPMAARDVTQSKHLKDWESPNPNRPSNHPKGVSSSPPTAWEKECKMLRSLGIDEEELVKYYRKIDSDVDNVNDWNDDIVMRFNGIGDLRRQYFVLAAGGGGEELRKIKIRIDNLKRQIHGLQQQIRAVNGTYESTPPLFKKPIVRA